MLTNNSYQNKRMIQNYAGGSGTLGFCAMRNGVKGYVTAGHVCKKVGDEISYDGTVIGTVKMHKYHQQSIADCGFIESNGAAYTSSAVFGGYYFDTVATTEMDCPVNTVIYLYEK